MPVSIAHFLALLFVILLQLPAAALEIRTYSPARHDRFITGANGLEINTAAYYGATAYTAVGFGTNPGDVRQFALVTPEHVLFAKHYSFGGNIRFINSNGTVLNRSIAALTEVTNGSGGVSDLIIMKLSAPISAADGITPFPYLNRVNEAAYNGTVLVTFGQDRRAGRGVLTSFSNVSQTGPPAIGTTRTFSFGHSAFTGNADDAVAVTGDSGSPTFAMANGKPALLGVHLAATRGTFTNNTTDTFVPHYADTVNGLLAPSGYQLIPATPPAVTLSASVADTPLRQTFPGTVEISLENESASSATNVRLELDFPSNAIPSSISAPGWIVENSPAGNYRLRSATLDGNSSTTVTATYSAVPVVSEIAISSLQRSDGSPETSQNLTLAVQETFAGYVSVLPQKGAGDDADGDGFSNLLEYAFGGNPGMNSANAAAGYALAPVFSSENGSFSLSFARRTDAVARGLGYEVEFSESLAENSWATTAPVGFSTGAAPYDPDVPGFEKVTINFPENGVEKRFVRVKITLDE